MTTTHTGSAVTGGPSAPAGHADHPCGACGQPLAAVLADYDRHILCHPTGHHEDRPA